MIRPANAAFKILSILAAALCILLTSPSVCAADAELEHIRHAIIEKGARWHADRTSISELSDHEKKLRLGAREDEDVMTDFLASAETVSIPNVAGKPAALDWRNVDGTSYVSPVKNQGACGSCWAFASTAGLESQAMISGGGMPVDLAEQILVSCGGMGSCSGGPLGGASDFLRDTGLPLESCFRYTATNNLCSNACLDWQSSAYRISGWHKVSSTTVTVDALRNALYAYGPVVAAMRVYEDFFSYRSGVYSYSTGAYAGGHAILIIGYDDGQQAFIVKNSWGSGWGEAGYFMVAYSEVSGASQFGYSALVYDLPGEIPVPESGPCSYSLSSNIRTFRPAGGKGSFFLYADGSCSLTSVNPISSASWLRAAVTSVGTDSVKVYYAVQPNAGPARSASINIAGQTFTVNQLQSSRAYERKR